MPLNILTQEKSMRTSSANSEHKHFEIERVSTSKKRIINYSITQRQKLKNSVIVSNVNKFSDLH